MAYSIEELKSQLTQSRGLAFTNLFLVTLPALEGFNTADLNIICKAANIPGRGVTTVNKGVGMVNPEIAIAQDIEPITLSFHLTNDYLIRKYFEEWQKRIVDTNKSAGPYTVGYHQEYVKDIKITQLRKGESFPVFNTNLGFDLNLPPIIRDRLPNIRVPDLIGNIGVGDIDIGDITQGNLGFALITSENRIYTAVMKDAFPTAMSPINFDDAPGSLGEINVTISYRNWYNEEENQRRTIGDVVSDTIETGINNTIGALIGTFGIGD